MLDHKRQLAFIAIPKNASLSIAAALQETKYPTYYHKAYIDFSESDYQKFCICRNPYDRIFSAYWFIVNNNLYYPEDVEFSKRVKQFSDFNEFVTNYLSFQEPPPCQVVDTYDTNMKTTCHFLPQSNWICNFWYEPFEDIKIYRYENLQKLEEELEIQMPFHYNKSNKPNYLDVYNEQSKAIIYSMYKYDFVNFGYQE